MAGSIEANLSYYKKQAFHYIPPSPPSDFIDSTIFVLHFGTRKFLQVGLDVDNDFKTSVNIITPSRYITVSPDLLKRLFSLMGNILSFVLDLPYKTDRIIFLDTECYTLSSMVYKKENVLVVESKTRTGCRVLLNRSDLISMQFMEWAIFEAVARKSEIVRPALLKQMDELIVFVNKEFVGGNRRTVEQISNFIKETRDDVLSQHVSESPQNFASQIKIYAPDQLARQLIQEQTEPLSYSSLFPEDDGLMVYDIPSTPMSFMQISPPHPMTPPPVDENAGIDETEGPRHFGRLHFEDHNTTIHFLPDVNAPKKRKILKRIAVHK